MKPPRTPHYNARWKLDHDPEARPAALTDMLSAFEEKELAA